MSDVYDGNTDIEYGGYSAQASASKVDGRGFIMRTYLLMSLGLFVSFGAAIATAYLFPQIFTSFGIVMTLLIAEVVVAIMFTATFHKASRATATALFLTYSLLTGVSLSSIFVYYEMSTFYLAFGSTAIAFVLMAVYGMITKKDLTRFGSMLSMGLIALLIASFMGFFLGGWFDALVCAIAVMLFMGITAYDSAMMKRYYAQAPNSEALNKMAIYCAMQLYLDFINIFIRLFRLIARFRKD